MKINVSSFFLLIAMLASGYLNAGGKKSLAARIAAHERSVAALDMHAQLPDLPARDRVYALQMAASVVGLHGKLTQELLQVQILSAEIQALLPKKGMPFEVVGIPMPDYGSREATQRKLEEEVGHTELSCVVEDVDTQFLKDNRELKKFTVYSPEARAVVLQTTKLHWTHSDKKYPNYMRLFATYLASDNEEVRAIGAMCANMFKQYKQRHAFRNILLQLATVVFMEQCPQDMRQWHTYSTDNLSHRVMQFVHKSRVQAACQAWLAQYGLLSLITQYAPSFLPQLDLINQLMLQLKIGDTTEIFPVLSAEKQRVFAAGIERATRQASAMQPMYHALSQKIIRELYDSAQKLPGRKLANLSMCTSNYLVRDFSTQQFARLVLDLKKEDPEKKASKPARRSPGKKKPAKSRQSRSTPAAPQASAPVVPDESRDEPAQEDSTTPTELPCIAIPKITEGAIAQLEYDRRVHAWFQEDVDASSRSILYHTFHPFVDGLILKIGRSEQRKNIGRGHHDMRYSTPGLIEYTDGRQTEYVEFEVTLDPKQICYHRGFVHLDKVPENFTQNLYAHEYPPLAGNEATGKREEFSLQVSNAMQQASYRENDFCIYVDDPKNNVRIALFKPMSIEA